MTQIVGRIKDSAGFLLSGKLVVKANSPITDSSTNPNSIITTKPFEFTITSGVVDINIKSSDIEQISYNFSFKVLADSLDGQNEYVELFGFNALVPEVASIDFSDLLPTDFTADQLDTGRFSIARIIATNEEFADAVRFKFKYRGAYSSTTIYSRDDVVIFDGSTYVYTNSQNSFNKVPPTNPIISNAHWTMLASRGATGAGATGVNTAYGAGWAGNLDVPTRNVLFNKIETLSPIASPIFTGTPKAPTQGVNDNTTNLATTAFINTSINLDYFRYVLDTTTMFTRDTFTLVPFNLAISSNNNFNTTLSEYTAPFAGFYSFISNVSFQSIGGTFISATALFYVNRFDGSVRQHRFYQIQAEQGAFVTTEGAYLIQLSAGDKVSVRVQVNTTNLIPIQFAAGSSTNRLCSFTGICLRRLS